MVRLRATPEDFQVTELALYEPCGEGEHLYLWVEKRDWTTERVASLLARSAGVPARDVGYAGRKDRHAVTRQWFSLPLRTGAEPPEVVADGVCVLESRRHRHKLRTGHLAGNRFQLRLREVGAQAGHRAAQRLEALARYGFANRFGQQRFGRAGDNQQAGAQIWRSGAVGRDRRAARFLLSAFQADVFNEVLEARAQLVEDAGSEPGSRAIDRLLLGDVAMVHASGGPFLVDDPAREQPRADAMEISPTGPIFGDRMRPAAGAVGELECSVLEARGIEAGKKLAGVKVPGTRRSLRARALHASWTDEGQGVALLEVTLEPGVYATTLLAELFPEEQLVEGSAGTEAGAKDGGRTDGPGATGGAGSGATRRT